MPRAEIVLPVLIVAAAVLLSISEFMTSFEFTPPGGEPLRDATAGDGHGYALLVLAIFAVVALTIAIVSGSRPAALAVAALGGAALLIFLVLELPDAGKLGDLEDPVRGIASARAEPQEGFWLSALGSVALALGGGALATLTSEQLQAPLSALRRRRERRRPAAPAPAGESGEPPNETIRRASGHGSGTRL